MNMNKLKKEKEVLIKRYMKISKVLNDFNFISKSEALSKVYTIKPEKDNNQIRGRVRFPISLIGSKITIKELKSKEAKGE